MYTYAGCVGCGLSQAPAASMSFPSSTPPWPSRTATGHRAPQRGGARARHVARGGGRGRARPPQLIGYGQAGETMAYLSWCGLESEGDLLALAISVSSLLEQLGSSVTMDTWYDDESGWCLELAYTPFLVVSPTTITTPWVDSTEVVAGEDLLDAVGDAFVEAVRSVDDLNRELGVADSNHRIDMGSVEVETRAMQSRFSVTVYPPVGVGDEGMGPEGPTEPSEEKAKWLIPVGIGAGILSIAAVVGTVIWARKKR